MYKVLKRPLFSVHKDPPTAPDFRLLRLLHRNLDSFVVFLHRPTLDAPELRTLKHVRVANLPAGLTESEELRCDGYFSINGFRKFGSRQTVDLSALNAAAVDLDFYKRSPSLRWQEVVETINLAVGKGVLPLPSVIVNSGQGAWLLWLLVAADDREFAPTAPPANQKFLHDINIRLAEIIAERLPEFNVDPASAELARCLRMPGSVNTKSGGYVNFLVHETPWGEPWSYTLDALAAEINVQPPAYRQYRRPLLIFADRPPSTVRKRGGGANLGRSMIRRLEELECIERSRGGFREGHRNFVVHITAVSLQALHRTAEEIESRVADLAARCQPPLPPAQVRWAVKSKRYKYGNRTIAQRLGVSVDEADALNLRDIRPDFVPCRPSANVRKGRRAMAAGRQQMLRQILDERDRSGRHDLPPLRELRQLLTERGFKTTLLTLTRDLDHLEIRRSHERGRPKRAARQLSLLPH